MNRLAITHLTLYKHGVGFFERRAKLSGQEASLSLRAEDMNDILKSLTAIDLSGGQVLGVTYATPQTAEERLAGCSIQLSDTRSLQDLLVGLRGRLVRLMLDQGEALEGQLVGLDEAPAEEPLATALVSILLNGSSWVQAVQLGRVQGVEILDERGAGDLRFFLEASLTQEKFRTVLVRLTPGEHDLSLSYVAPAPTWRVSYRLVVEDEVEADSGSPPQRSALLLGWGIFDNRLEEDLQDISLSLVAGMPISFVYDLYTPFTPQRPEVKEELRVAAAPVAFEEATLEVAAATAPKALAEDDATRAKAMRTLAAQAPRAISAEALAEATPVSVSGAELGELFEYVIDTPVTVGRGQSAMVPIVSARLICCKDLLYNGSKMPEHPVATLRLQNTSGLALERGPLTVIDAAEGRAGGAQYAGEAVLPFTAPEGELVVPYAVELGLRVQEENGSSRELYGLRITGHYLQIEEWDVRWRQYRANNRTARPLSMLVEHPRTAHYELFDTPDPQEQTAQHARFSLEVPAHGEAMVKVQERRLVSRREELRRQSSQALQGYLKRGLLDTKVYNRLTHLLELWGQIADHERRLAEIEQERNGVYRSQEQMRGNLQALSTTGKEGDLRASYVDKLRASEQQLEAQAAEEKQLQQEIQRLQRAIDAELKALGS